LVAAIVEFTNASVASLVVLSAVVCVVAVVPLGNAGVPLRLAAVPVVFWFHVGTVPPSCEYCTCALLQAPLAVIPVAYCPEVHCVGVAARAVAVAALPVVFWLRVGNVAFARLIVGLPLMAPVDIPTVNVCRAVHELAPPSNCELI
jgi:hypothetical protein